MAEVITTLSDIVTHIGPRGVLGQETTCTISLYQGSLFVVDLDVHLADPIIMERLFVDVGRK